MSDCWPTDVTEWVKSRGLDGYYTTYLKLVRKHLKPETMSARIQCDPEGDDDWITVDVDVAGDADSVYVKYDRLTEAEVRSKQDFSRFHVSINIVEKPSYD